MVAKESEIGPISTVLLKNLVNGEPRLTGSRAPARRACAALAPAILATLNHLIEAGFPLPTLDGAALVDPAVDYASGVPFVVCRAR